MQQDPRRSSPRIGIEARCWEVVGDHEASSLVVDLSSHGVRLERPFLPVTWEDSPMIELGSAGKTDRPSRFDRVVPLQLEVPELDELMWARGDVVFDELVPSSTKGGPFGLMRRTGYHISLAASRDLRLLRDFVYATHEKRTAIMRTEAAMAAMIATPIHKTTVKLDWFFT